MKNRAGVSLIEVLVALTLFAMIATVHTQATFRYGAQQRLIAIGAERSAASAAVVEMYTTMPRANIAATAGCADVSTYTHFPHERCVTVSAISSTVTRVRIIITPDNPKLKSDTLIVDRVTGNSTPVFQ